MTQFVDQGTGWTNSYAGALAEAKRWLEQMHIDGLRDVELASSGTFFPGDGPGLDMWEFEFRHTVTGEVATLKTHGIDHMPAFRKDHLFCPRSYWNGSSLGEPCLEDFEADGFRKIQTFEPIG